MVALLHPGVYVHEVPSGIRSIEGVPTSTTIFVGETERGPLGPTKIRSAGDYARIFGGHQRHTGTTYTPAAGEDEASITTGTPSPKLTTRYAVDLFFQNGGGVAYVLRASDNDRVASLGTFVAASPGEFGEHVYVVIQNRSTTQFRVLVYYLMPGATVPELVEDWDRLTIAPADENFVIEVLKRSLYIRWHNDVAPLALPTATDLTGISNPPDRLSGADLATLMDATRLTDYDATNGNNNDSTLGDTSLDDKLLALDGVDDAALLVGATERWLATASFNAVAYFEVLRTYVDARPKQDLFLVGDAVGDDADDAAEFITGTGTPPAGGVTTSNFAALYWPHLEVADPVGATPTSTIRVPPAGAVAGLYSRTDARRGVWKAPAGVEATVGGIVGLQRNTLDSEQDDLNPIGLNVIRVMPGAGSVIWGSRTLQPASEWRYVPVRRTAMFLRKSIYNGIQFSVFEPNDTGLWSTLRATIGAFMETQFRNGAFAGRTSSEAYFVKVDTETTTEIDQAAGIVNVLVGFAPLRPAEFVVVKLSQKTASGT